jgi:hypothetical protein
MRSAPPAHERNLVRNAKFNTLTVGLFAKHVIIEIWDGDDAQAAFQSLLDDLHQQFEPFSSHLVSS